MQQQVSGMLRNAVHHSAPAKLPVINPPQAPSITDLPPDLLRRIFSTLLPSAEPQPLLDVGQQWLSLQLTCKAWAAALQADPPIPLAVSASLPPPGSVPWLQEHAAVLHLKAVNRLEVASVDDFRGADVGSRVFDWVQRHCGLPHADALWIPSEYSGSDEAYVRCAVRYEDWSVLLLAGHETVPASCSERLGIRAGAPVLALPECSNLQVHGGCSSACSGDPRQTSGDAVCAVTAAVQP